jgi:hypothetical protein
MDDISQTPMERVAQNSQAGWILALQNVVESEPEVEPKAEPKAEPRLEPDQHQGIEKHFVLDTATVPATETATVPAAKTATVPATETAAKPISNPEEDIVAYRGTEEDLITYLDVDR